MSTFQAWITDSISVVIKENKIIVNNNDTKESIIMSYDLFLTVASFLYSKGQI